MRRGDKGAYMTQQDGCQALPSSAHNPHIVPFQVITCHTAGVPQLKFYLKD